MPPALDAAPLPAAERLAFPLDVPTLDEAEGWVERLAPSVGLFKVGLELFCTAGPEAVRAVAAAGSACFLDLKLHDIPATMAGAAAAVAGPEVRYLTVHAAAGP
ncbi:MAG: orotidine 5'-phosphate decarboxylase / HUMPS family protein, partial [Myxococcota bacterium]